VAISSLRSLTGLQAVPKGVLLNERSSASSLSFLLLSDFLKGMEPLNASSSSSSRHLYFPFNI
jgi:hypothetical protein